MGAVPIASSRQHKPESIAFAIQITLRFVMEMQRNRMNQSSIPSGMTRVNRKTCPPPVRGLAIFPATK